MSFIIQMEKEITCEFNEIFFYLNIFVFSSFLNSKIFKIIPNLVVEDVLKTMDLVFLYVSQKAKKVHC